MPIVGNNDERRIIKPSEQDFTNPPLPSITAIDTNVENGDENRGGIGTGIVISPNYILTAAHVLYNKFIDEPKFVNKIRVSSSGNQPSLPDRIIGEGDKGNVNAQTGLFLPFDREFRTAPANTNEENRFDIALIEVDDTNLILGASSVGLTAFVAPRTVRDTEFPIQTAGYPADNVPNTYPSGRPNNKGIPDRQGKMINSPGDFTRQGKDLVLAPGNFNEKGAVTSTDGRRILYSNNIDTVSGQSGSPIWTIIPEAEGENELEIPRVLAVHSRGGGAANAGALIDKDAYDLIVKKIKGDGNPDKLPENAIIGSSASEKINGTYRKELILGLGGNDTLFGAGADDRLEGADGIDQAVFSEVFTNYEFTTPSATTSAFEFEHVTVAGPNDDGTDTTKEIEFAIFESFDSNGERVTDPSQLFYVPLLVDPNNPEKLRDGPIITPREQVLDADGENIAEMRVESPAWMFDGDVEYDLTIGLDLTLPYNLID